MPRFPAIALCGVLLAACGGGDDAPDNAASQVQQGIQAAQEAQEETAPPQPVRNEALEEQCRSVTQNAMDAVEEKMKDLSGELVVLTGDEQQALTCSRYRKYLRGELSSY